MKAYPIWVFSFLTALMLNLPLTFFSTSEYSGYAFGKTKAKNNPSNTSDTRSASERRCDELSVRQEAACSADKLSAASCRAALLALSSAGCSGGIGQPAEDECKKLGDDLAKAKTDFVKSAGGDIDNGLNTVYSCNTCKGTKAKESYCPGADAQKAYDKQAKAAKASGEELPSEISPGVLLSCPTIAAKKINELKDKLSEHKNKISELTDQIQEAQDSLNKAQTKFANESEDINTAYEKALKKLKEDTKIELKDKRKAYDELSSKILEATNQQQEVTNTRLKAIRDSENQCYAESLKQLQEFLTARYNQINAGTLSAGSTNALLNSTGTTRRQKDAKFADQIYRTCTGRKDYKDKIRSIDESYALALKKINQAVNSYRQQQLGLIKEISGQETQQKFIDDVSEIQKTHDKNLTQAQRSFNTEAQALQKKLDKLQADLKRENLENIFTKNAYAAASRSSDGSDKEDPGAKLNENFASYSVAAENYVRSCCDDKSSSTCEAAKRASCLLDTGVDTTCKGYGIDLTKLKSWSTGIKGAKK